MFWGRVVVKISRETLYTMYRQGLTLMEDVENYISTRQAQFVSRLINVCTNVPSSQYDTQGHHIQTDVPVVRDTEISIS